MKGVKKRFIAPLVAVLTLVMSFHAFGEGKGSSPKERRIAQRINSVRTLIERSSLASRIIESGSQEAESLRQEALHLHSDAKKAHEAGDDAKAGALLVEAQKKLYQGVKALGAGKDDKVKKKKDFEHRLKSVRALVEAQKRVTEESEKPSSEKRVADEVSELIKEAMELYDAGDVDKGREALDKAYDLATSSLKGMRAGMTKVRDLKFETKEEEYEFVKRFSDDYVSLANQFIGDYLKDTEGNEKAQRMKKHFEEGMRLRVEAEKKAAEGDFEGGIETLEDSIKEIKRAIRIAGFMIF